MNNKLDIKEETFDHLVTVLSILFGDAREVQLNAENKSKKDWNIANKKEKRLYNEGKNYLKNYLESLLED